MKWIIIGYGWAGRLHADALEADKEDVVAIVDPYQNQISPRIKIYNSICDFNNSDKQADVAIIASWTPTHLDIARELFKLKIPTLIEKPVGTTYNQTCEIAELADKHRVKWMAGFTSFFHPEFVTVEQAIKNGEIGEVTKISEVLIEPATFGQYKTHLRSETAFRGVITTQGIHSFSRVVQFLGLGSNVVKAEYDRRFFSEEADVETYANIMVEKNNVPYTIELGFSQRGKLNYVVTIYGSEIDEFRRFIRVDGTKRATLFYGKRQKAILYEHVPLPKKFKRHTLEELPNHFRGFREEQRYFRNYVVGAKTEPYPSLETVLDAHRLMDEAYVKQSV